MKKRDFLQDLNIWGAVMVSRSSHILNYSLRCLLKYCDNILIMVDNEDEATQKLVEKYKSKYPDIIRVEHSGFPRATQKQEEVFKGLLRRFKKYNEKIREKVFEYLREKHKKKKIDILIWPDHDEVFSDYFPTLLKDFWKSDKMAITMKPVDPFGDFMTIHNHSMTGHTRIMKFFPELTAIPYRTACYYRPLTKTNRMGSNRVLIHLASINADIQKWRKEHWKPSIRSSEALWKLPKDIRKMTPDEIKKELKREPDCTVEEYLRGGDKRKPMGKINANKALYQASIALDKMGVRHYLAFGTALTIYRDNEIKNLDWDIDYICDAEDLDKIDKNQLDRLGFSDFKKKRDIPKWKNKKNEESEELYVRTISFKRANCRIDIDPAYISADGKNRLILKGRKREKFVAQHPKEWFDNAKEILFNNKKYLIPNPPEEYLYSNYGETWNKPIYGPMPWRKRSCMREEYACK